MQVILDSSFARLGSAPVWGGKKGEFRDWTMGARARDPAASHFDHKKIVVWVPISIHTCGFFFYN